MIDTNELRRRIDWGYKVANGVVSEILDRLEAAEKESALRERVIDALGSELNAVANERDALRSKITELEQQEPIKHEFQERDGTWHSFINQRQYENTVADGTWPIRSLYALPGAQGEEK